MEDHQPTTEHVKEEVLDTVEFVEVDSQDVQQLCTACLCSTRTTRTLDDDALKQYYMHILTEMQPEGGDVVLQSPRLCWECMSHLKRSVRFREQVKQSYILLCSAVTTCLTEDAAVCLQTSVSAGPERLRACTAFAIDIAPQDDEAASECLDDNIQTHFAASEETVTTMNEELLESFCDEDENIIIRVTDDLIESPLKSNYEAHDKNNEQSEETDAHAGTHRNIRNYIKTTPNSTHESTGNVNTAFVCDYCYKSFTSIVALERHIASYNIYPHNNKTVPSPCKDCAVVLCSDDQCSECPNKHNILQHKNMETNISKVLDQGKMCHKLFSFKRSQLRQKRTHNGEKPYQCEMCHKSFSRKHLVAHLRTHAGEKPFECKVCNKLFIQKHQLVSHLRIHTGDKPYQCKVCNKSFSINSRLVRHLRTHTGEKPFHCEVCHKLFSHKHNLLSHLRIHTGEKPYQCKVCNKSFSENSALVKHFRTHTGEKPFHCEVCHKLFSHKYNLLCHLRIHTGEKPFQCEVCHKLFSLKHHLLNHLKIHTGEKPSFQWEVCHKSFSTKSNLAHHIRTHTGKKPVGTPYLCDLCHKSFSLKGTLVKHIRTHTGEKSFQCKVCYKSFPENTAMVRHFRTHTGEKPYQCKVCNKSFSENSSLVRHFRTHTGEKPFQCEVCHKLFSTKSNLACHIRKHSNHIGDLPMRD